MIGPVEFTHELRFEKARVIRVAGMISNWIEYRLGIDLNLHTQLQGGCPSHPYGVTVTHHSGSASFITSPMLIVNDSIVLNAIRIWGSTRASM